jgi:hypothetical protein
MSLFLSSCLVVEGVVPDPSVVAEGQGEVQTEGSDEVPSIDGPIEIPFDPGYSKLKVAPFSERMISTAVVSSWKRESSGFRKGL